MWNRHRDGGAVGSGNGDRFEGRRLRPLDRPATVHGNDPCAYVHGQSVRNTASVRSRPRRGPGRDHRGFATTCSDPVFDAVSQDSRRTHRASDTSPRADFHNGHPFSWSSRRRTYRRTWELRSAASPASGLAIPGTTTSGSRWVGDSVRLPVGGADHTDRDGLVRIGELASSPWFSSGDPTRGLPGSERGLRTTNTPERVRAHAWLWPARPPDALPPTR
jgi:hypothetical protein